MTKMATAGFVLSLLLFLAKPLDYILKLAPRAFPLLSNFLMFDSLLRLITEVQPPKHQGPIMKIHYLAIV